MNPSPDPMVQVPEAHGPDAGAGAIALAPLPLATTTTGLDHRPHALDAVVTLLVLVVAFLAASFLARNSDLWFHLATGRLLAQGPFTFGVDPFAYTTAQVYWPCHSWLFDLGLYRLYVLTGGAGLVVLKALLVTLLAGLLLRIHRPGGALWLPAVCTTLAILAMSPRLLVQPACFSYVLLGLTFWLLCRPHTVAKEAGQGSEPARQRAWPLPVVFALWVNVDEWFLLGPLLAALFWLGERWRGQRVTPGWIVPVGLAACLLSPHTFHAFTLPAELSPVSWTSGLRQDVRFQALFASPWQAEYLHTASRLSAAALAYFLLTALGLASFLCHRPALRDWRLIVWLPFALLAASQARMIPFFAVIAAPITALNWQDVLASRPVVPRSRIGRYGSLGGRLLLVVALAALACLTWLGGLAGYDREERHVAWGIQADPSLQQVTETLHYWRREGLLPAGERVFALAPEVAQYSAWFCPGERQFFDHRYPLYPQAGRDYETVCVELLPELVSARPHGLFSFTNGNQDTSGRGTDWRQVLRDHHVGVLIFYDRDPQRLLTALHRVAGDPEHWTLLHVAGQAMMVGWNDARPPGSAAPPAFDADRLVFGVQDEKARHEAPAAPEHGPKDLLARRDFRARLKRPAPPPSWESAAATVYLHYFHDSEAAQHQRQFRFSLRSFAAGLVGLPAQRAACPQAISQLASSHALLFPLDETPRFLVRQQFGPFFEVLVDRPAALPLLAIRAARRAVAVNPEDSNAWLRLGQAYLLLSHLTREHSAEGLLPPLAQLRHVQIVTALQQAVRLDPDLEVAHHELAHLYGERDYVDQALEHRREEVRLSRRAGQRSGESTEEYAHRLELLDRDTAKLIDQVEDRRKRYSASAPALQGDRLAQAKLALKLGLVRLAVTEVLLPAPADVLGAEGIKLELEVLLSLGMAQEVRAILGDKGLQGSEHRLGFYQVTLPRGGDGGPLYALPYRWSAYEWLHVLEAAAVGDYAQAQDSLQEIRAGLRAGQARLHQQALALERRLWIFLPGLLSGPPPILPALAAGAFGGAIEQRTFLKAGETALRAHEADLCVLEGLLALEQGTPEAARARFVEALQLTQLSGDEVPFAGRPLAVGYLGKLNIRY